MHAVSLQEILVPNVEYVALTLTSYRGITHYQQLSLPAVETETLLHRPSSPRHHKYPGKATLGIQASCACANPTTIRPQPLPWADMPAGSDHFQQPPIPKHQDKILMHSLFNWWLKIIDSSYYINAPLSITMNDTAAIGLIYALYYSYVRYICSRPEYPTNWVHTERPGRSETERGCIRTECRF